MTIEAASVILAPRLDRGQIEAAAHVPDQVADAAQPYGAPAPR